jgi:acetyl esterase/lipase
MKKLLLLVAVIVCEASGVLLAADPPEILLWPKGMPEPVVPAEPAEIVEMGKDGIQRRTNISRPRLFVHVPPEGTARTGAGIIVVPGGGFGRLADGHEGSEACEWLAKQGVVAFQLAHRTPTTNHKEVNAGPVQDAQKSVIEVRQRAKEYGVDPQKVGILGFSAGGQVTIVAASSDLQFPATAGSPSHKPDFLLLIYPYKIYDPMTKGLRADIHLDSGLPPTFLAQMSDDGASLPQGTALLYLELVNRKIPAEIHVYERGGHGFGMRVRPDSPGTADRTKRAAEGLQLRGYGGK